MRKAVHVRAFAVARAGMMNVRPNLLPCQVESLVLLLVQLLDGLQDFGFVILNNPLLLHQVVVLQRMEGDQTALGFICPEIKSDLIPKLRS